MLTYQITNSAPNHNVLGRLNGLAQTLSAAGRAAGPFLSGGLFSLSTRVRPKGEALAWGVFGGVAFVGFCLSFGIRSSSLEGGAWEEDENDDDEECHVAVVAAEHPSHDTARDPGHVDHDGRAEETQPLLSKRK